MLNLILQSATRGRSFLAIFRHLGTTGLFFFTIIDSSPIPAFGGADILIALLAATRRNPWYEYAGVATLGSTIGAYISYRLARKAGEEYLEKKFGNAKVSALLGVFRKWATSALVVSAAVPVPMPTSFVFAAAGTSEYRLGRFVAVVAASRGARYSAIGILAELYGRPFIRIIRHPAEHWGWLLVILALLAVPAAGLLVFNKRLQRGQPRVEAM
jgi:membrane protein YqaA with SNARE-associated domain